MFEYLNFLSLLKNLNYYFNSDSLSERKKILKKLINTYGALFEKNHVSIYILSLRL